MEKRGLGDYLETPWKNGGGATAQIAVGPAGAGLDDFIWRISMARVERDGAFSAFPGIDRSLIVLTGNGVTLTLGGEDRVLRRDDVPLLFDGGMAASARLLDGAIVDFNVMTQRASVRHNVKRWQEGAALEAGDGLIALFCVASAQLRVDGVSQRLERWETLLDIGQSRITIEAGAVLAVFIRGTTFGPDRNLPEPSMNR